MNQADAHGLITYIQASPSPFHAVEEAARRLRVYGFQPIDEGAAPTPLPPGSGGYVVRDGALVAWRAGSEAPVSAGLRIVGAHTDSPTLRVKPHPDTSAEGYRMLAVEPYGGMIRATWTDRDLGVSGQVVVRTDHGPEGRLFRCDRPVARVPNVAIHLNREVNKEGLKLNAQKQLPPVLGLGDWGGFRQWLAHELQLEDEDAILSWELGLHDVQPATIGGIDGEFVFASRLDNLASSYAAIEALCAARPRAATQVVALFDHEEVGSRSWRGAMGPMLRQVLTRIIRDHAVQAPGGLERAAANSWMVSADMVHGIHPNYADRHEPGHKPVLNGGPVIKTHSETRYATDARTAALFRLACEDAGVPCQDYAHRSDSPCGSTIGPISAAELGIPTVDVGCSMLSMHSIREQAGAADVPLYVAALKSALES